MTSRKVPVILLEDVPNLGQVGDIVSVSEGYARNALFPHAKAALATESDKRANEQRRQTEQRKATEALARVQQAAAQIDGTELVLTTRVKDGNEIFGKITTTHIAKELKKQASLDLKAKDILLPEPITTLGSYDVALRLKYDVEATIKVAVLPEPGSEPNQPDDE